MNNRPLKFRAWTGYSMEYKVMAGHLGAFYCDGMNPKDSACLSDANTIYHEITPIMQYTGLKDKNGKEIWEGDIVLDPTANGEIYKIVSRQEGGEYIISGKQWYDQLLSRTRYCEVIGNIYENPELLT